MPNVYQQSFWDDDEGELWDDLASVILEVYFSGVDGGVSALPPGMQVLTDFDRVNTDALAFAKQYRYELIKGITDTTRKQVQQAVTDWIQSGAPLDALEAVLEKTFGPVRAEMIAQTETTRVFAMGNQDAWKSTGLVDEMEIRNAADDRVCPICSPKGGTRIEIGATGNLPPFHIRCRCWLQPVVSEEALAEQLDRILA